MIAIKSNAITLNKGNVLMEKSSDGTYNLPGELLFEGDNPETALQSHRNLQIIKPLSPKISWSKIGEKKIPFISLNYLTRPANV